jgi:hypothetical protein
MSQVTAVTPKETQPTAASMIKNHYNSIESAINKNQQAKNTKSI